MKTITTIADLESIYTGTIPPGAKTKVTDHITDAYAELIEASPFAVLATVGSDGVDCSPRGDRPGFVRIADSRTLLMPDRRGNNRIDSLRNIVGDPRTTLMFMIPGCGNVLRVNAEATILVDEGLQESFAVDGKIPQTVIRFTVVEAYFQCARAVIRSELWNPDRFVDPKSLPTPGQILSALSEGRVEAAAHDRQWSQQVKETLW